MPLATAIRIVSTDAEVKTLRDATVANFAAAYQCCPNQAPYPSLATAKRLVAEGAAVAVAVYSGAMPYAWCLVEPTGRFAWLSLCVPGGTVGVGEAVAALVKAIHERTAPCWGHVENERVRELVREHRPEIEEAGEYLIWP